MTKAELIKALQKANDRESGWLGSSDDAPGTHARTPVKVAERVPILVE
jgi:hypothetical protein